MLIKNKICLLLFLLGTIVLCAQTPGFNYQALILNTTEIQIPGTNVTKNQVPLGLEEVTLRFTITNEADIEYTEKQTITTDENGMVSVIVGEGTAITNTFGDIVWDGKLKYLSVEIDIISNNEGFVFLDTQKILHLPHPTNGTGNVNIVNTLLNYNPPFNLGDLIWIPNYDNSGRPSLMIWDGKKWALVNEDFDPTNELGLVVVSGSTDRDTQFTNPEIGDQVWNQSCKCIQVFDGFNWTSININALNGLHNEGNTIKLGGALIEPTVITTNKENTLAIKGLEQSAENEDKIVVIDEYTGVLRQKTVSSIIQRKQVVVFAIDGQIEFSTPLNITSTDKIDVYRNGVRIAFTAINNTTIKLEPEAVCYKNDKIRIVQLY